MNVLRFKCEIFTHDSKLMTFWDVDKKLDIIYRHFVGK